MSIDRMTAASTPSAAPGDLKRAAVVVTMVMLGLHLVAAGRLEFMFDEAYYRLWAEHLSWGYHDHPPGIAAWIRLSTMSMSKCV